MANKAILTSRGLTSVTGFEIIKRELQDFYVKNKKIFLFQGPYDFIVPALIDSCLQIGFQKENIIVWDEKTKIMPDFSSISIVYITEGNTFEIYDMLIKCGLNTTIQKWFSQGNNRILVGASAGAIIAGEDISEAESFDKNFVQLKERRGLGLVEGVIIPHYSKSELKRYIKNTGIQNKYSKIYNIANDGVLTLENNR